MNEREFTSNIMGRFCESCEMFKFVEMSNIRAQFIIVAIIAFTLYFSWWLFAYVLRQERPKINPNTQMAYSSYREVLEYNSALCSWAVMNGIVTATVVIWSLVLLGYELTYKFSISGVCV